MKNIEKQLKQFRTDAIYGKKRHYNAADRKRRYYSFLSVSQIIINAITGTTLFTVVLGDGNKIGQIVALIFTILATILSSIQKLYNYEKQAQGNAKVGDMYLEISKSINLTLCMMSDGILTQSELLNKIDDVCKNIAQANKLGSQFPPNNHDFEKARRGVRDGEEDYTAEELELWK